MDPAGGRWSVRGEGGAIMTRRQSIKAYYLWLHHGDRTSVRNCTMFGHPLYAYRTGRKRDDRPADGRQEYDSRTGRDYRFDKPPQQAKGIRACCLGCRENSAEVMRCPHRDCALWTWRSGKASKPSFLESDEGGGRVEPRLSNLDLKNASTERKIDHGLKAEGAISWHRTKNI